MVAKAATPNVTMACELFQAESNQSPKTLEETLNSSLKPRRIYLEDLFQEVSYQHRVTIV